MVIWLIGLSGAGKTTIGRQLADRLRERGRPVVMLDGDQFRWVLGDDVGHGMADREKNGQRMQRMCKFLEDQGIDVVCCILSLFPAQRAENRTLFSRYVETYIKVDFDELCRRDQKGLYSAAQRGEATNVAGFDIPFPPPANPDIVVDNSVPTGDVTPLVEQILAGVQAIEARP